MNTYSVAAVLLKNLPNGDLNISLNHRLYAAHSEAEAIGLHTKEAMKLRPEHRLFKVTCLLVANSDLFANEVKK